MNGEGGNNPFVGLRPFESSESLLFFGRQDQTLELLQRLHEHHFVAVIGSSGSGKSSLVRAGLIPKLQAGYLVNEKDRWVIVVMKPGQTPICNFAAALLSEPALAIDNFTSTSLEEKIKDEGVDAVLEILAPLRDNRINLFVLVDQFEELFRFSLHQTDFDRKDEAKDFVNIILALSNQEELPIYVVTTMRSDFIGDCALVYGLPEAMNKSQYIVPRLNRLQLRNTIEGPVRLYNGKINAALTARLLNDTQLINDELPLLQHALMRTWDYEETQNRNGELDLDDYKTIGGIEMALCNHADEALQGMTEEELYLTKKMFQALTAVDENGRKIRRPARLSELVLVTGGNRGQLLRIINHFIEGKRFFLVVSKVENSDDSVIDISHESLIRQWGKLSKWVEEEAEARNTFLDLSKTARRLTNAATLFEENKHDLLQGLELQIALHWLQSFKPDAAWAQRYGSDYEKTIQFLRASEARQQELQKEKERQQLQKRRNRRLLIAGLIAVILIISGFAYAIYKNNLENKKKLVLNYWSSSQAAHDKNDLLASQHFTAEAIELNNDKDLSKNLLTDIDPFLPQAALDTIFSFQDVINGVDFHPSKPWLALAGSDGTVRIIETETGKPVGAVMQHEAPVYFAYFTADGKWLLTGSNDKTARLWDVATGRARVVLPHPASVVDAAFSPGEKQVITACVDGYARLWDAATGKQLDSFEHPAAVTAAAFSPDGKWILTASIDSVARLREVATGRQILLPKKNGSLISAVFTKQGNRFLTAGSDPTICIWDTEEPTQPLLTIQTHSFVKAAVFSPDGNWVLTSDANGYARLWDATTGRQIGSALKHEGPVYNIAFRKDGKQIATTGWDRIVRLWRAPAIGTTKPALIAKGDDELTSAVFNANGTKILATGSAASIWDAASKKQILVLPHEETVNSAVFSPDGKQVVTTCDDGIVRLWDANTGIEKDSLALKKPVTKAVFSLDGKRVLTADGSRRIFVLDAANLELLDTFTYKAYVKSIVQSADGQRFLVAGTDSTAQLLDAKSKKTTTVFKHQDVVNSAIFSPDGKQVVTGSYDFTARLWNAVTGQQIGPSMKHDKGVKMVVFSPDGKWMATTSWDNTMALWDVASLRQIGTAIKREGGFNSAVFSPDGAKILTAGANGWLELWDAGGDLDLPTELFKLQVKALTGTEFNLGTGETQCLPLEQWKPLKQAYYEQGRKHFKTCKYPAYNRWRRFYLEDAQRVWQEVKTSE